MANSGQQTAFQTLFEGDAVRIENAYSSSLPAADAAALGAEQNSQKGAAGAGLAGVPTALVTLFGAPYDLGVELLAVLNNKSGNTAVDDAFPNPPIDEAQIFDPWLYLTNQQPDKVAEPSVAKSQKKFDGGDFGALSWYVTLAQRIDPHLALQAADAWAGDSYVAFGQNQKVCMPGSTAVVTGRGNGIELNSCDPWVTANLAPLPAAEAALALPVARTDTALGFLNKASQFPRPVAPATPWPGPTAPRTCPTRRGPRSRRPPGWCACRRPPPPAGEPRRAQPARRYGRRAWPCAQSCHARLPRNPPPAGSPAARWGYHAVRWPLTRSRWLRPPRRSPPAPSRPGRSGT